MRHAYREMRKGVVCLVLGSAVAFGATVTAQAEPAVSQQRLLSAQDEAHNWLIAYGDYASQMHSKLSQINRGNIVNLVPKFLFAIGGTDPYGESGRAPSHQQNPVVNEGFMYVHNQWGELIKIDVRSGTRGQAVWMNDPEMETIKRGKRGSPSLLGNYVFNATSDMRLFKIDADSGETVFEASTMGDIVNESSSAPSMAVNNQIVVAQVGGQRLGWVGAFSADDGALMWRFMAIPGPGEFGHETWADDWGAWKTGGAGAWGGSSYDPETNLVIFGLGDPWPWGEPEFRPGDNLFTASIVAVDADTGVRRWHFQETPNESWDFGTPSPKMLYDLEVDGRMRKVEGHFARNGFYYTLDRATGDFIFGQAYTEVNWTAGLDPKTGMPLEYDPNVLVQQYANKSSLRANQPDTAQNVCPYFYGAPTYFTPTFDADRMMAWSLASDGCWNQTLDTNYDKEKSRAGEYVGNRVSLWDRELIGGTQNGRIVAVDVRTGGRVNQLVVPNVIYSGLLGTAGDLIFTGHLDGKFAAYDKDTLSEVWSFNVGTPITAPPISYSVDGKQYIAIVTGGQIASSSIGVAPELRALYKQAAQVVVFGLM